MEYVLWGGALLMLAMAPCISLVVYANSTSDSPTWMGGVVQIVAAVLLMLAGLRQRSVRKSPEKMSQSSFREKSDLLVLLSLCCVFLGYYALSWNLSAPAMVPILVGAVVVLVVINIVGHIALAVMHAPMDELNDGPDERDLGASQGIAPCLLRTGCRNLDHSGIGCLSSISVVHCQRSVWVYGHR